jgi:adenosylcobinamide-phosphate synthase
MMEQAAIIALLILGLALVLDWFGNEYPPRVHPVVWMGRMISFLMRKAPAAGWWRQFLFGMVLTIIVVGVWGAASFGIMYAAGLLPLLALLPGAFLLKGSFALRELGAAANRVRYPLEMGDLPAARHALRSLCSRDPTHLDSEALLAATLQSLAENLSDSFVAPMFYYALAGVPGAIAYRAINTLDAMIGYHGKYEALGKFAARLDDVVNWIPARLTAGLLLLAGRISRKDTAAGWRILRRDGRKTPSPNGGRPMAVLAGLLGVRLEKKGVYTLGDPIHPLTPASVREAWRLVTRTAWLMAGLCAVGTALMCYFVIR